MWERNYQILLFDALNLSFLGLAIFLGLGGTDEEFFMTYVSLISWSGLFLTLVGFGVGVLFEGKQISTLGRILFAVPSSSAQSGPLPFWRSFWGIQSVVTLVVAAGVGLIVTKATLWEIFDERGLKGAFNLFVALFQPNWRLLPQAIYNVLVTIFMAFVATIFAIPLAFVLSFLCAKNIMRHPVARSIYFILRTLLNFIRSVEALIWAIIFSVWVGIGPFAGMLALMIHSVASLAKQYSEMVESVSEEPIDGILSTGASHLQTIWFAIVPQVVLPFISFTVYRWDTNVRMATIIGFVGGGGIGTMLLKYQGQAMWNEVGTIVLVIALVVWAMDQASAIIREALK
ncbi:MAG: phosphonate transporter, permease protein PhnE [Pseudomonadota bacterium]|jgi:phosphonate transport system permease protein